MARKIRVSFDIELGPGHDNRTISTLVKPALELAIRKAMPGVRAKHLSTKVEPIRKEKKS